MPVHERLLRSLPAYAAARAESENRAWAFARRGAEPRPYVTVIPVVVHVVARRGRPEEEIPDTQVASQLAVLRADFRARNSDLGRVPAAFRELIADARIELELATVDPLGRPTTGITRTATANGPFDVDDAVKSAATGGADAWPAERYLNIWVCQLAADLLGYAQFPGGPAATDGVVVRHTAFGTTGTATAPFHLGRTATHEVGHWLNLRHIWGDDGAGCHGSDHVADTPNQAGPNYGAPAFPRVSCGNGPDGDMFMNFMDYVDDEAMFMLTGGQVARIHACLDGERAGLGWPKPEPEPEVVEPARGR